MFSNRTGWPLTPNRLTQTLEQARSAGCTILDLTVSNPTRVGFVYDRAAILNSLRSESSLDYDPQPKGLHTSRAAVAHYYRESGLQVDPESLILTNSTSEGYSYVFRLLANAGDEILVPKPSYPLFEFLADLQDVKLVSYPLIYDHGWQIDFHSLEQVISPATRGIVLVNPNNPTGSYVNATQRKLLDEICRDRELALIVDEVFLDYALDGLPHLSFVSHARTLTFTLSGLSKISALPQMKFAWIAVSGPEAGARAALQRLEVVADTYLSLSAPVQWAAPKLLDQRRTVQPQILERVRANIAELDEQLSRQQPCARLRIEGGWYAVLRVPVTQPDEDLAITLLREHGVLVHPGHFYDFASDGFLVLSLITPKEEFRAGICKILDSVRG